MCWPTDWLALDGRDAVWDKTKESRMEAPRLSGEEGMHLSLGPSCLSHAALSAYTVSYTHLTLPTMAVV